MNHLFWSVLLATIIFTTTFSTANAQGFPDTRAQEATPDFYIWGARSSTDGQVGIMVRMPEPWKTYWRTPGQGGEIPSITWHEQSNVKSLQWHWPTPKRLMSGDIPIIGYEDTVFFPITAQPEDIHEAISLSGEFTLPMCTTICTFHRFDFELELPPGEPMGSTQKALWDDYWGSEPLSETTPLEYDWHPGQDEHQLVIQYNGSSIIDALIFESPHGVLPMRFEEPEIINGNIAITVKSWADLPSELPDNISVQIIEEEGSKIFPLSKTLQLSKESSASLPWWSWFFAFGGGFILNLMPCVLPVLGMKLNSLIVSDNPKIIRQQLLYSASGVIGTFVFIGVALSILQVTGHQIGWGVQFQNPWFLGALVALVSGFAISLLFGMNWLLPRSWMDKLTTAGSDKPFGHVVQGATATLLATPCTAPMLGTAIGLALATSPLLSVGLFTVMGLGMASPWLLVALYPPAQRILPKPGPWLAWVKPIFGIAMLGTAIWLAAIWWQYHGSDNEIQTGDKWSTFSQELLKHHIEQGDTVLVDITAAWCMTCQSNKALVLETSSTQKYLDDNDVIRLQGDWTRQNDTISDYIQSHQKHGIPLNVVYGPGFSEGIVLPEILTFGAVESAVESISGK